MAINLTFLQTPPINVTKAVEACPQLLYLPIETLQSKIDNLRSLGVRPEIVVQQFPQVLASSKRVLHKRFALLEELGLNAKRIFERCPTILAGSDGAFHAHIDFFERMGLDGKRIINAQPKVLGRNPDGGLLPVVEFITQIMGRSLEEINRTPSCFTYSLEKRMKPRYQYMLHHGVRKDYALSTLFTPCDQQFAWSVARQPLQHFRDWSEAGL